MAMYMQPADQQRLIKVEEQINGEGEVKKKKKKKPFDPYRPKKQLSKVWKAFRDTPEGAFCNYCGALRKRNDSSTKSLWEHLKQKHVDVLKSLKGDDAPLVSNNVTTSSSRQTNTNIGTEIQNVCTTLLQGSNNYDTPANSFNIMATLQGAAPTHQLFTGFGLAPNGALASTAASSGGDRHGSVLDILAAGHGSRQGGNVFAPVGRSSLPSRSLIIPQSQGSMITLSQWRLEPVTSKDTIGINFILRGIRADNNSSYTSTELQADMGNATYKTVSGDLIQLSGAMQNDNKEPFRNGFQNWHNYALQQMMRTFK